MLSPNPDAHFEERKIDPEVAARFGASFNREVFRFEYRDRGVLQFTKCRSVEKKFWIEPAGQPLLLWGLDSIRDLPSPAGTLIIVEGEFDRLAFLHLPGVYVVSVPNGAPSTPTTGELRVADDKRFSYIWGQDEKLIPELQQFEKIILATDADGPGYILRDELAMRLGEVRCWFVDYPKGCKDANDTLMAYGTRGLSVVLDRARPMRPGCLVKPSDVPPARYEQTYATGWECMDVHMRLARPELMVVTGIPNHGKGIWVRALCCKMAEQNGFRTAFLAPEDPAYRIKRDLRRFAVRPRYDHGSKVLTSRSEEEATKWMDEHFRISMPSDDDPLTVDFLENEIASAALHHDCKIFVADPWNEFIHQMNRLTETQYIEAMLPRLKRLSRKYGIILIIVAHPRKIEAGGVPTLYTINGSANWKNKCDHGIIINRLMDDSGENFTDTIEVIVEKSKDHETMGTPGKVLMTCNRDTCDYHGFS
jgi:twinkle protein